MVFPANARVGQQGSLTYIRAAKGSRPRASRDQRRASAHLFGAVCPARGVGAALVLPCANIEAMNLHLAEISRWVAPFVGELIPRIISCSSSPHAVITLDGAGWHQTGGSLEIPGNISLLALPPYSPEPCVAKNSPPDCFLNAPHQSKISGNTCAKTTAQTEFSKPMTPS